MELLWDRNNPAGVPVGGARKIVLKKTDRQAAYDLGHQYVQSTQRIRKTNPKVTDEEKRSWDAMEKLVKKYEGSGQIETMEKLIKRLKEARER